MSLVSRVRAAFDALRSRRRLEQEMEEELRFHMESEAERLEATGVSREEAHRQSRVAFGGVENIREEVRDARGARLLDDVLHDMRYARRTLLRRPAFTVVAVLTLAIGIGATTALFSVVKAVLLTPLPYKDPSQVALIWSAWRGFDQTWLSFDEYEAFEHEVTAFENVALFSDAAVNITEGDQPERVRAGAVMHDVFDILGVQPLHGRAFTQEEDRPNGPNVIMLSYELWMDRFAGDAGMVGRDIQVNGRATTVVGVMPKGFRLPLDFHGAGPTRAWIPLATDAEANGAVPGPVWSMQGQNHGYYGVARLRADATLDQANAELATSVRLATEDGVFPVAMQYRAYAVSANEQVTGRIRPALLIVLGAVAFVMLIACANVAGLMLVRGEARRRELAVRVALGASSARLTRQLLTESLVLAGVGGAVGIAFAAVAVVLVRRIAPAGLPRFSEATLDLPVLVCAVAATIAAALLAGVLPAMQASRNAPSNDLKESGRATAGITRVRWRQVLVATEVALAVVLVVGAGLMIRTVANLLSIDAGLDPRNVLTMRLSTPAVFYETGADIEQFHSELLRRVREIPGVVAAGSVRILPLATEMGDWGVQVEGYTPPPNSGGTPSDWQVVMPGYFEAMGLQLRDGRFFDDRDLGDAPMALIVNRRFVELYLDGGAALGRRVRIGGAQNAPYTIVGVVDNVRHNGLTREVKAQFYAPLGQFARAPGNLTRSANLVVKTGSAPMSVLPAVRRIIRELDPRMPVAEITTMEEVVSRSIAAPRFAMTLLGLFGALALLLSSVGIFGIVAQLVAARQHEFGIRAALGAEPRQLVMMSVRGGIVQTAAGLAIGVVAALALTRVLESLLQGVTPTDLTTFASVIVVTGVVAMLATIGPARRAGKADPMTVLHD